MAWVSTPWPWALFWALKLALIQAQPSSEINVTTLNLCVMMGTNTKGKVFDYLRGGAALDMGMKFIEEEVLPPGYQVRKVHRDLGDSCSPKGHTVAFALDLQFNGIQCAAFIGPGCGYSAESISDIAEYYDIPIIGVPAAGVGLSAPASEYEVIVRVSIVYDMIADALMQFFSENNYTSPTFMRDTSFPFYDELGILVEARVKDRSFKLYASSTFLQFDGAAITDEGIRLMLRNTLKNSRVMIIQANSNMTRRIMVIAHSLGMTRGEHLFIAIDLYESDLWGEFTFRRGDSLDKEARAAFQSLFLLSMTQDTTLSTDVFWAQVKKLANSTYGYQFRADEDLDPVVAHFYDAMLLFGYTVRKQVEKGLGIGGREFFKAVANTEFQSSVSGLIRFNEASDRISDFVLQSFDYRTGKHTVLYSLPGGGQPTKRLGTLDWFGNDTLPPNTPRCGFDGLHPICTEITIPLTQGQTASAVILPLLFFATLVLTIVYGVKRLFFTDKDPFWWRIFQHEMEVSKGVASLSQKSMAESTSNKSQVSRQKTLEADMQTLLDEEQGAVKNLASINGALHTVHQLAEPKRVPQSLSRELRQLKKVENANLHRFVGVVVNEENQCVFTVGELCARGTLKRLLDDEKIQLDWSFKNSLLKDLINGLAFLHTTKIASHGFLNDEICYIDSRFVLKISGYGVESLQAVDDFQVPNQVQTERNWRLLLYRAPELLRRVMPDRGTQKGDVYSYAIFMQQIILRTNPFEMPVHEAVRRKIETANMIDIVMEVKRGSTPPVRPTVPLSACPAELHELMDNCWQEDPFDRPSSSRVKMIALRIIGKSGDNIVDHLIKRMEQYAAGLESQVEKQMRQFLEERQRSQDLLQTLLPPTIAQAMLRGTAIAPETYPNTTVYFGDVHGFSEAIESLKSPVDTVGLLNHLCSLYDEILPSYDCFKVESVNYAYLIVSGLPVRNGHKHVAEIAAMALDMRRKVNMMKFPATTGMMFKLRVGINTGPCVAAVVGLQLPRYCLFGDTVNTASRMESHGEAGKIHCSESTKEALDRFPDFILVERGEVTIKGKGTMRTHWLVGRN